MTPYQTRGYTDRLDYLRCMSEDYGLSLDAVHRLAAVLGPAGDFDERFIASLRREAQALEAGTSTAPASLEVFIVGVYCGPCGAEHEAVVLEFDTAHDAHVAMDALKRSSTVSHVVLTTGEK